MCVDGGRIGTRGERVGGEACEGVSAAGASGDLRATFAGAPVLITACLGWWSAVWLREGLRCAVTYYRERRDDYVDESPAVPFARPATGTGRLA